MSKITIPRKFFDDHADRDLPTPDVLWSTKRTVTISYYDPALPDLMNDARHYADEDGPDEAGGLRQSARALLRYFGQ